MSEEKYTYPSVFLSSVFKEEIDGEWKDLPLRKQIIDSRCSLPVRLWAYEIFWPKGSEKPDPSADTVIDRCFAGIRECDLFVFLLTKRHGTGVEFSEGRVRASYLEMELFAAAMLQKPILVLHEREYEAEEPLNATLKLLKQAFPPDHYITADADTLNKSFRAECNKLAITSKTGFIVHTLPVAVADYLSHLRSRRNARDELTDPALRFQDGNLQSSDASADPTKAKLLLDQVASGVRDSPPRLLPHGVALFRLWAAMRELMDRANSTLSDPASASLWDRAFGMWAGHSSWFGLHGHLLMGPLAAVQMQSQLRQKFVAEPAFNHAIDVREPLGARASAVYSIAQRMQSRSQKVRQFKLAEELATQAIKQDSDSLQGARLIRGHASLRLAQLGHLWRIWDAKADFQTALASREQTGAPPARIGEAKVAYGFSCILTGRQPFGLAMVQDGVDQMRNDKSADGQAFLARGLRNLERCAKFARRPDVAATAREERLTLSKDIQAMDQMKDF